MLTQRLRIKWCLENTSLCTTTQSLVLKIHKSTQLPANGVVLLNCQNLKKAALINQMIWFLWRATPTITSVSDQAQSFLFTHSLQIWRILISNHPRTWVYLRSVCIFTMTMKERESIQLEKFWLMGTEASLMTDLTSVS